jgi:hypothetical protein
MALARDLGVLAGADLQIAAPRPTCDDVLQLVHEPAYVAAVRGAPGRASAHLHDTFGLGSEDNPVFDGMHEASALVTGATVDAARAVRSGAAQHAVNLAGGLHHAMPARASGFCVYNDAAVAIAWLLADGVRKVAYVDLDAHHGDGVEAALYSKPRVLTIGLHESGYTAFPARASRRSLDTALRRAPRSTSRCRPAPGTPAGCARSTPSCRRSCGPSSHRSSSPSSAATPIASIPWPSSTSRSTRTGTAMPRCTGWRARSPAVAGSRSAVAGTRSCRSSPGRGPTCSPRSPATRWIPSPRRPSAGGNSSTGAPGARDRSCSPTARNRSTGRGTPERATPTTRWIARSPPPAVRSSPDHGLDHLDPR